MLILINTFFFMFFIFYVFINFRIRLKSINNTELILFYISWILFIIYSSIFIYNVYIFNNTSSLSYGQDSTLFESIWIQMNNSSYDATLFQLYTAEQKIFHIYLFHPLYYLNDNYIFNGFIFFIFNFILMQLTIISSLKIVKYLFPNYNKNLTYLLILYFPAFVISLTFLRDVYILFFLIEFLYVLLFFQKRIFKLLSIILILISLSFLRFYFTLVLLIYLLTYLIKKNKFFIPLLLFIISLSLIFLFNSPEHTKYIFGKLLVLQEADLNSIAKYTALQIDISRFNSNGYTNIELVMLALNRLIFGFSTFIIAPISSSYFLYFLNLDASYLNFYYFSGNMLIQTVYAFFSNFLIIPALLTLLFELKKDIIHITAKQKIFYTYLFTLVFSTAIIYGIKFMGHSNFKISFIVLFIEILLLSGRQIKINIYYISIVFIMLLMNIYFATKMLSQ